MPLTVGVLHHRGVRGEGGPRSLLHGDRRRSLVCHRVFFKVSTYIVMVQLYFPHRRKVICNIVYFYFRSLSGLTMNT